MGVSAGELVNEDEHISMSRSMYRRDWTAKPNSG
jgi:hypothetical protein